MRPTTLKITCWLAALGLSAPGLAVAQRGGTEAAGMAADPRGALRFERISVKDPGLNGAEAVSFLAPAGWKSEGGIQWFPDHSVLANLLMRLSDPESGAAIEFLPVQNFTWLANPVIPMQEGTNYLGNIVWHPIEDPVEFVRTFYAPQALRHLGNARVVGKEDLPNVAAEVARAYGGQSPVRASRVRFAYEAGGQPWEEDVYLTLVYTTWQMGTIWSVYSAYSFRAPHGRLEAMTPRMRTAIDSLRLGKEWYCGYMYVQKLFMERMAQGIANARAISDTITRNTEEIRRMFSDSYRQTCESRERISRSFSEHIRGVDTYRDPFQEQAIQLPSGYRDAWVSARGEYLLSNQAGFDPNVGDTAEWRRMPRRGEDGR